MNVSKDAGADDPRDDHVAELPDGAGCTEIWEHIAERRKEGGDESSDGCRD